MHIIFTSRLPSGTMPARGNCRDDAISDLFQSSCFHFPFRDDHLVRSDFTVSGEKQN